MNTAASGRFRRDLTIFAVTVISCAIGVVVAIVAVNLTGANDDRQVNRVTVPELEELNDRLEHIRPSDVPTEEGRQAVDDARDLVRSVEEGDTVIVTTTPDLPPTTTSPPTTAAPTTTTTEGEPSFGDRLLPLPDFADPDYHPPTTEVP